MKIDWELNLRYGGIALLWIGPALFFLAGIGVLRTWQIRNWPTATAQVLQNDVEVSKRPIGFSLRGRVANADYFTARCRYQYEVNGEPFTETGICASDFDRDEVERLRRQYSVGTDITIHYSPDRPQDSVLTTAADVLGLSMMFGFGLVAIPVGMAMKRAARNMQPEVSAATVAAGPVARETHCSPPVTSSRREPVPAGQGAVPGKAKPTRWLLRSIAVCVGLALFLVGGMLLVACAGQFAKGANAPAALKLGVPVQIAVAAIFGLVALLGAFLIWMGMRRTGRSLETASAGQLGADFGQFIARCGPQKSGQLNSYLWGVAMLAFAVSCVLAPGRLIEIRPGHEQMGKIISLAAAGLSLAFAVGILWTPLLGAPQIIELYENGLVERLGNQVRRIEFEAIEHLQLAEWYEHRFAQPSVNVKAQVHGQRQLAFSSTLRGEAQRIIEYLASHIRQTEFVEFNATL